MEPWLAVDFDGTLAIYNHYMGAGVVGEPIPAMVEQVKKWLAEGYNIRIFTARAFPIGTFEANSMPQERIQEALCNIAAIERWCQRHIGKVLRVTCVKDYGCTALYDDRAYRVEANTGRILGE